MTFHRGVTLTTATTLGHADTSNLGPSAGNGFYKRWPDDLALLQDLGVTDLRLTLDWARLQPKPGDLDGDWSERFDNIVDAAAAIELRVWATLYDGASPRWIDNEGGLADEDTVTTWWPRWVERVADRFGDRISGWIPFAAIPDSLPQQPWSDTWTVLDGGEAPVVAAVGHDRLDTIQRFLAEADRIGLAMSTDVAPDHDPTEEELAAVGGQLGDALMRAAELAEDIPLVVSEYSPHHTDPDVNGLLVGRFVDAVDAAIEDGVDIGVCFLDPAIAGPDSPVGLLDKDRSPQPAASAFLPPTPD
ncbi:MAG: family 1 glycosylhydrolase [Ilumatobacter sp.]|nr:family 1 glycosylhydrolase [Ilumatobacter sp.]